MKKRTPTALLILLLAACTPAEDPETTNLWLDDRGTRISEVLDPQRIIVLSPSLTEMIYTLGEEERIVAVSRYCRWPDAARELPQVGGGLDPDTESILALQPDLVLSSVTALSPPLKKLEQIGLPVALLNQTSLEDVFVDFKKLSLWLGVGEKGGRLLRTWKSEQEKLQNRVGELTEPLPRAVVLYNSNNLLSAGHNTFASDLVQLAGGENLPDQTGDPWPILNPEVLLKWNPDVIFFSLNGDETPNEVKAKLLQFRKDPRWSQLEAVKKDRLYPIPDSLLAIPGPRSLEAARTIAQYLHGVKPSPRP